jgi:hypothetical protein
MSGMFNEKYRRPNISFTEMLKKGVGGQYRERGDYVPTMYRALVIAMDSEGGKLESPDGHPIDGNKLHVIVTSQEGEQLAKYDVTPTFGPYNPKNSVRARIMTNNIDQVIPDDELRTYWPLFPGADTPSAGEMVYVMFEDETMHHGLWVAKVPMSEPDPNDPDAPQSTKNLILMSGVLKKRKDSGNKEIWTDTEMPKPSDDDPSPVRSNQRLTELFSD